MEFKGKGVCGGVAFGKIKIFSAEKEPIRHYHVNETDVEIARFRMARESGLLELEELYKMACGKIGAGDAAIFEMHSLMLSDDMFTGEVENEILFEHINAEYAIEKVRDRFVDMFRNMEDDTFSIRSIDVKDISERVINILLGRDNWLEPYREAAIIVADELMPSKTVQFSKDYVRAFVTKNGAVNSHSAIIAKQMGITAITAVDFGDMPLDAIDGKLAKVDGDNGIITI